jgi:ectoine hydroxylase
VRPDPSPNGYRAAFGPDGYLVREAVLDRAECARLHEAVESVSEAVTAHASRPGAGPSANLADGHRIQLSARTAIQWEWMEGSRAIRLLEPCDHLHPGLGRLFDDPRLTTPVAAELGGATAPFTSKLNFKRAAEGSEFPWHQDFPYWYTAIGNAAQDVITAIVFLDDATAANGALRVIPGSHLRGPVRRDPSDPTRFLADATAVDVDAAVTLEVPIGSVVWFGAFLVHCSSPNRSGRDRRALLPSWQPAGRDRLQAFPYDFTRVEDLP